jgi:hypothetical protein
VYDRVKYDTAEGRYTLHSNTGRLVLIGPPPGPTDEAVRLLVARMANGEIAWKVTADGIRSRFAIVPEARPGTATAVLFRGTIPRWAKPAPSALRPLLRALDDADKALAAHAALCGRPKFFPLHPSWIQRQEKTVSYDGLPIRFILARDGATVADPSAWRSLRDQWHDPLDVKLATVSHRHIVLITALPPLLWSGVRLRRALTRWRRKRRGLCLACGYDLRHSCERCPECGAPAARNEPQHNPV